MVDEMVLTVIARDRPGLVKALSEMIASTAATGSTAPWRGSAGVRWHPGVSVPSSESDALEAALGRLGDAGISVAIRKGQDEHSGARGPPRPARAHRRRSSRHHPPYLKCALGAQHQH